MKILKMLLLLAVICLLPAYPGVQAATDKEFKREDPFFSPARTVLDPCEGDSTLTVVADGLSVVFSATTAFSESRLNGYSCVSWPERGPEMIYELAVTDSMQFWAGILDEGVLDLDIFLLGGCDSDACLEGANLEVSGNIGPLGTYFLVVDGYSYDYGQVGGPFTLGFEGRVIGLPQSICDNPDVKFDLVDLAADPDYLFVGDLFEQENLLQSYECSPYLERGGEIWFEIPAWQASSFEVRVIPLIEDLGLDLAIWLFDGCGPEAACLGFADDATGDEEETLVWERQPDSPDFIYLGVDCTRVPVGDVTSLLFSLGFGSTIELLGVPLSICLDPDVQLDFETLAAFPDSIIQGDLFGKSNLLELYEPCSPLKVRGGEIWFEIPAWQATDFTVNVAPTAIDLDLDLVLWLFGECGPEVACLGFANENASGQVETLTWVKQEGGPTTIYLGVDCTQAPTSAGINGLFNMSFGSSIVETESTSWGDLRGRYR